MAMLQAVQADVMVQMGRRARAADQAEVVAGGEPMWSKQCRETFVPDEIGVLLGWTKMAAVARYETACRAADCRWSRKRGGPGWSMPARSPSSVNRSAIWTRPPHRQVRCSKPSTTSPRPGRCRTGPQLRQWLRRKVIEVNPEAAEDRRQRAHRRPAGGHHARGRRDVLSCGRCCRGCRAGKSRQALTTAAQQLGADDARTMDQRRADTLVDLLLGRAEPAAGGPAGDRRRRHPHRQVSDEPGWVPGLGPVTATEVAELVGR